MTKPTLPKSTRSHTSSSRANKLGSKVKRKINRRKQDNSDVLISAVISSNLLTHLHHVLQRAEYGAIKEGRNTHAVNFAQLRKVLCMDARSMQDASAIGLRDGDLDNYQESNLQSKAA